MANLVFNFVFTAEAIIKIIALKTSYFYEAWNTFDFSIVSLTYIFLFLEWTGILSGFGQTTTILRALRIGRVLRLINKAKKLQIIIYTIMNSSASLGSLGLLLMLFFFMFAVIGAQNFGLAYIGEPQSELNVHTNFQNFFSAWFTLLRCSTGEGWEGIMYDLGRQYSPRFQCREDEDYDSLMANGG